MSKRKWGMQADLNSLRAEIVNVCTQLRITVFYQELQNSDYLTDILLEISRVSHVQLAEGDMMAEDLKQFLDDVREAMNLKERTRRIKRTKIIATIKCSTYGVMARVIEALTKMLGKLGCGNVIDEGMDLDFGTIDATIANEPPVFQYRAGYLEYNDQTSVRVGLHDSQNT
ncbi:hypothetical protein MIR68_002079 [Amoeboaphelidium protococcarum]|nr:hypothetical protein MIR68_002079 [Amoeboaphelidium protococcarum]